MKKQPVSAAARRGMSTGAQRLLRSSMMDTGALLGEYGNTCAGYDEETVLARRGQYGRNETSVEKPEPFYKKLSEAFINPFTVVLFILAAILFLTDVYGHNNRCYGTYKRDAAFCTGSALRQRRG